MKRDRIVAVAFSRETEEGVEHVYEVECAVSPVIRATRLDPEEGGEVEVIRVTPVGDAPPLPEDDLSPGEIETIEDAARDAASEPEDVPEWRAGRREDL